MRSISNPTIRDVAERAGVSLTTVSYVLSGRSGGTTRISRPTQERVMAAAGELGYVPNQAARGMRRGRTDLVAIAIGDLEWPPDRALATAAASILPRHGYQPVILLGQTWRQFMLSGGADGVIVGVAPHAAAQDGTIASSPGAEWRRWSSRKPCTRPVLTSWCPLPALRNPSVGGSQHLSERAVSMLVDRLGGHTPPAGIRVAVPRKLTLRGATLDVHRAVPSAVGILLVRVARA